jgi:hypothetical protein
LGILFSVWLWLAIAGNTFRTVMGKLMICLLMLGLLLGYGDVRPSMDARFVAASEALLGYIWMALFIGMFAVLFKQPTEGTSRF